MLTLVSEQLLRLTNTIMSINTGKFNGTVMAPLSIFRVLSVLTIVYKIYLSRKGEREQKSSVY